VDFLAHESCGQCVPCREGLRQMRNILNRIAGGRGREGDIELLEELCDLLADASMCALGATAPNPVRSALKHFRGEFEAHVRERRCPSLVCRDLYRYEIDASTCAGCLICKRECPADAIVGEGKAPRRIDQAKCTKCGNCLTACPARFGAVHKVAGVPGAAAAAFNGGVAS